MERQMTPHYTNVGFTPSLSFLVILGVYGKRLLQRHLSAMQPYPKSWKAHAPGLSVKLRAVVPGAERFC